MKILLVNHYAGSSKYGMEYRPFYLCREWVKQGHKVTIIAATYTHLRQINPIVNKDFSEEYIEGIKYIWIKVPSYKSSLKRIINMGTFVIKLMNNAKKIAKKEKPNLVIASSTYPIDIYPCKKIADIAGAKLCYEVHDLWPLSPMLIGGYSKKHPFIRVMQKGEDDCYKYSDKVISLLWNAEEHMKEHGLAEGKFKCIPNGYNPDEWTDEALTLPLPKEHVDAFNALNGKIIVGFAGSFSSSGALGTLIEVAELLKEDLRIHFVLIGNGSDKKNIEKMVLQKKLSNVTLLPAVTKVLIPAINNKFDIAYMGGVHSFLHKYGTSYNKMTDSMLSKKPLIQAVDEPGCITERVGCGIQVEAENPRKIADAILIIANMSEEERKAMGEKGYKYASEHLPWSVLAKDFIETFE